MTAYQVLPGLLPDEYAALRDDIAAHGVRVPVDVDENGQVLDGHHRSLIAAELGIDCPRRVLPDLTEAEKVAHALAVNVHRRTLSREQKRDLLAASIKADPEASDREHARRVGTDHKTASAVRNDLESTGEVPQLADRRGADGRTRPASQPPRPRTSPAPASLPGQTAAATGRDPIGVGEPDVTGVTLSRDEFLAQRETGEVLSPADWQTETAVEPSSAAEPPAPARRALPEQARNAGWELRKVTDRLERIAADDRFGTHHKQMAAHLRGHLIHTVEVCQDLLDRLPETNGA